MLAFPAPSDRDLPDDAPEPGNSAGPVCHGPRDRLLLSSGDVCVRFWISSRYVLKLFKNHYGETVRTRLVTYRIRRAKQLIRHTDEPLYLFSERSGFKDYLTLTAALKRVEGVTPRRYRQTIMLKSES